MIWPSEHLFGPWLTSDRNRSTSPADGKGFPEVIHQKKYHFYAHKQIDSKKWWYIQKYDFTNDIFWNQSMTNIRMKRIDGFQKQKDDANNPRDKNPGKWSHFLCNFQIYTWARHW